MKAFVLSVLFVSVLGLCECCKCAVRPNLDLGCGSDFIIETKVKSELRDPADPEDFYGFYYKINKPSYANIYKFNYLSDVSSANKARVYTSGSTASCGVHLEDGKTYILSGSVNKDKQRMEINSCSSWVEETGQISPESQKLLMQFQQESVKCPMGA
ncbi:uncharacterized protein LOC127838227 [Dreissena polymorpha]|uniref:NTR domain-containing protein n=1 Tax=Dreissena polymorpha TaxID=45954 RepID=A0A9D4RXA0_DREPO|nr:uncharacterized protein LOC127838227 [Dreissena polymorpha]KAH3884731.1 hypothetical protein DPMN_008717 [Dreissena polymorpha]